MSSDITDQTGSDTDAQPQPALRAGTVSAVEPQVRDLSRVNVFIEGQFVIGLAAELAAELQIHPGRRLTEEDLQNLAKQDRFGRALLVAIRFASHTPRTAGEVERRLQRAGVETDLQARVLTRLADMKLLDDRRYLGAYLESRIRNQGYGPRRVREELVRRGMARDTVEAALASFLGETSVLQVAEEQARRRWSKLSGEGDARKARRKLFDFLIRRGFSSETAREAVGRVVRLDDETC